MSVISGVFELRWKYFQTYLVTMSSGGTFPLSSGAPPPNTIKAHLSSQ